MTDHRGRQNDSFPYADPKLGTILSFGVGVNETVLQTTTSYSYSTSLFPHCPVGSLFPCFIVNSVQIPATTRNRHCSTTTFFSFRVNVDNKVQEDNGFYQGNLARYVQALAPTIISIISFDIITDTFAFCSR